VSNVLRVAGYSLLQLARRDEHGRRRIDMRKALLEWHWKLDPLRLVTHGDEPDLGARTAGRVVER
jgi:hypothetical protein